MRVVAVRPVVAAAVAALLLGAGGCANVIAGDGKPSKAAEAMRPVSLDDVEKRIPDDDFYGSGIEVDDDPDEPYTTLCPGLELADAGEGVDSIVRQITGMPDSDIGGDDVFVDESILVFSDPSDASTYLTDLVDQAPDCDTSTTGESSDRTTEYSFEGHEYLNGRWRGWVSYVTIDNTYTDGSTDQGGEVDLLAGNGNLVVYSSWLVTPIDAPNATNLDLEKKIDEFLEDLKPAN